MATPDITLITLDYPPEVGGVARYLGNLVQASEGGIKVIVQDKHGTQGPGQVEERNMFSLTWPTWRPQIEICRQIAKPGIVLVSHVLPVGTAAWISKILGGPDYVVIVHGLDVRLAHKFFKRFLLRRICHRAKALIAVSESTKQELLSLVPHAKVSVLTPGVEERTLVSRQEARMKLGLDAEKKIVLSVTRLVPRKGIDVAIKAMARVQKHVDADYAVLGFGHDLTRLQFITKENNTQVRWILDANDETKWLWLAAADIFLLPVREENNDVEGFGIVYLEAALAGLPSIAGKSGGAPEAVRHERTGLVVDPESVGEVEQATLKLLNDQEIRQSLGNQARIRARQDFRWPDRWDKLKAIIQSS